MNKSIKLFSILVAIFISSYLLSEQSQAATCWNGTCKATCSDIEEPSTQAGDGCQETYEICCVPKSCTGSAGCVTTSSCEKIVSGSCSSGKSCCDKLAATSEDSCKELVNGAPCTTTAGKSGTCKSGFCSTVISGNKTESGTGWNSDDLEQFNLPDAGGTGDAREVIIGVMDWLLAIVGIVAIIAFVISGFQYFMVATDEKMMESAKKTMKTAIIGIIVALSGFIAIRAIDSMLNVDSLF